MKVLDRLSEKEKSELKSGVIEVTGKAMNRTALGVVDALIQLYPKATFEDLKKMLPDTINESAPKNYKSLFKPHTKKSYGVIQPGSIKKECQELGLDINASHFTEPDEIFRSSDGLEVMVSKSWESSDTVTGENDLQNLINHVKQYGIIVNDTEPTSEPLKTGSYKLYILNNELLKEVNNFKKTNYLFLGIAVAIVISLITLYLVTKS